MMLQHPALSAVNRLLQYREVATSSLQDHHNERKLAVFARLRYFFGFSPSLSASSLLPVISGGKYASHVHPPKKGIQAACQHQQWPTSAFGSHLSNQLHLALGCDWQVGIDRDGKALVAKVHRPCLALLHRRADFIAVFGQCLAKGVRRELG